MIDILKELPKKKDRRKRRVRVREICQPIRYGWITCWCAEKDLIWVRYGASPDSYPAPAEHCTITG